MDNFGLVDAIEDYCEDKSIIFHLGDQAYVNSLLDPTSYPSGKKVIFCNFLMYPDKSSGKTTSIKYEGYISLGQKREATTESSLDETPIQKYKRRLNALATEIDSIIEDLCCINELDVQNVKIEFKINQFDLNIDIVDTTLTFVQ